MPVGVHDARFMELSKVSVVDAGSAAKVHFYDILACILKLMQVKLSSSLSWLSGSMQEQQSMETAKHVLLNPYGVTSVSCLTLPCTTTHAIYNPVLNSQFMKCGQAILE